MGCCESSHKAYVPSSVKSQCSLVPSQLPRSSVSRVKASENRALPPVEEETVKEVLSETPKWKPPITVSEPKKQTHNPFFDKTQLGRKKTSPLFPIHKAQELRTASEVSLSHSISTTNLADVKEKDEFRQRNYTSPANLSKNQTSTGSGREGSVGKSPTRRSEISPGRRDSGLGSGSMRLVQSIEQSSQNSTASRNMSSEAKRRDLGERSGRRSRSPATRTDNGAPKPLVGRSSSARRTNPSPGRGKMARVDHDGGSSARKSEQQPRKQNKRSSTNESLEHPLVSLECFIFL